MGEDSPAVLPQKSLAQVDGHGDQAFAVLPPPSKGSGRIPCDGRKRVDDKRSERKSWVERNYSAIVKNIGFSCHPERSEGSLHSMGEIRRCAQNDG